MNFLAHSYLSFEDPGLTAGNYLGDFIRNTQVNALPMSIQRGIRLHRSIDSYTDHHPSVKEGTKLLHAGFHKYAPVVLDIYFDFLLSKFWATYDNGSLSGFCQGVYAVLRDQMEHMPLKLGQRMERMTAAGWLENYQTYDGLQRTFNFLERRAKFPSNLSKGSELLLPLEAALGDIFIVFFPDLISFTKEEITKLDGPFR